MNLKILEQVFFGNRILDYIIALLTLTLSLLFVKVLIRFFIRRLKKLAQRSTATFGDFLIKILEKIGLPEQMLRTLLRKNSGRSFGNMRLILRKQVR